MTPEQIRARIETASARLAELQADLDAKEALLRQGRDVNGDGTFDMGDRDTVRRVRDRTLTAQNRIDGLLQQLFLAETEAEGTPITTIEFEGEGSFVEGEHGTIRFADKEGEFLNQISSWKNSVNIALNAIADAANDISETSSFPRGDIVGLATTVLSACGVPVISTATNVANTLFNIALSAYQASLPPAPSVRLIQAEWRNALNQIDDARAREIFHQLVEVFRNHFGIYREQEFIPDRYLDQWNTLQNEFRSGNLLPTDVSISRAFMTYFIRNAPDTDGDMIVGDVTVEMEFDKDRNRFRFSSGSMEDITPQVQHGLTDNSDFFGPGGVISLPTAICFKISGTGIFAGHLCDFYRVSATSGNTDFRLIPDPTSDLTVSEQEALLRQFIDQRVYSTVPVNDVLH